MRRFERKAHHEAIGHEYDWYRAHGGKLTESGYKSVFAEVNREEMSSSTRSQAIHMMDTIPRTASGRVRRYIHSEVATRVYGALREPMKHECASWSDQQIFAEVLLILHYVAGNAAFERKYPNIFH